MRTAMNETTPGAGGRQHGFTLIEAVITLFVVSQVLLGVLMLFDFCHKLSQVQMSVADMQESLRVGKQEIARWTRMAGRGGLPGGVLPSGIAVAVRDNVALSSTIGGAGTPTVAEGTDVLSVRGIFSTPLYQVNLTSAANFTLDNMASPQLATGGTVTIAATTPSGLSQSLQPLLDAVQNGVPEAILLVSPRDAATYAVVELNPAASNVTNPSQAVVAFKISGGTNTASYATLSPGGAFPKELTTVAFAGLLEEHRFYVRQMYAIANDSTSDPAPRLARARTYPGTNLPFRGDATNWSIDVADHVADLQVALGLDSPNGGGAIADDTDDVGNDDRIFEAANGNNDDWLFNGPNDNAAGPEWANASLYYLRFSLLAFTGRRDSSYQGPLLGQLEDHVYPASYTLNSRQNRMFRRRIVQTVINTRNLL
jgi:Tfp pilus assembly protein PilV